MNATGMPGAYDVTGCNRSDSSEGRCRQWYS